VLDAAGALRDALSLAAPPDAVTESAHASLASDSAAAACASRRRFARGALRAATAGAVAAEAAPSAAASAPINPGDAARSYTTVLSGLLLDTCPRLSGDHHYRTDASKGVHNATQQRRVAKECAGLVALLPCTPSSSIFVRAEEASTSLWRALITGPEGTPYAGGCFVFDIYFPSSYPQVPPKVNLCTTGGGKVRFNPNLYNCGKVCLSLLGTWPGGKGEGWDPAASSVLQVLVSIQSLILVAQPYFNEPGFERSMGTPSGDNMNREYNANIQEGTLRYAILEALRKPKPEFESVIKAHFSARRDIILAECRTWVEDARDPARKSTLAQLAEELEQELKALPGASTSS